MKPGTRGLVIIALCVPLYAAGPQGQEVFEKVCSECHGAKGTGNKVADNFYKMQIPRLDSEAVQKMSDAELKEVIMKGRRKMKPPLAGTPYMRHSVKPELLDETVGYIRTLKKGA
jgi:mono/diheme cytochrome c family protein